MNYKNISGETTSTIDPSLKQDIRYLKFLHKLTVASAKTPFYWVPLKDTKKRIIQNNVTRINSF